MSVETFKTTTLGAAAMAVVEGLAPKRDFIAKPIAHGEIITAPGVYDMPIEWHHDNCCAGPSVSSTGLRTIDLKSPAHYWGFSPLNPNRRDPEDEDADHFVMGRAAHTLFLGESGFREKFILRPKKAPDGRDWNGNNKTCREWLGDAKAMGRSVLTEAQIEIIKGMSESLAKDPLVSQGLLNGEIEKSIVWKDDETGIWLKSRPDALPVMADLVSDLKVVADASPLAVDRALESHGYYMQLALVGMGMKAVFGRDLSDESYALVFVEKKYPFVVNPVLIDPADILIGRAQIRRALRTMAECLRTGEWPGYRDHTARLFPRTRTRLENELKLSGILSEVA